MLVLDDYWTAVFSNLAMIGNNIAFLYSIRNTWVCAFQLNRSRKLIHLLNLLQVFFMAVMRIFAAAEGLFMLNICSIFPLGASLWHATYVLIQATLLLRCLVVVENPQQARMVKLIGGLLLLVRLADWPYEISTYVISLSRTNSEAFQSGVDKPVVCYVAWEPGVLYLGFIADSLSNIFFGGLFVYWLRKHLAEYSWIPHMGNSLSDRIEMLARKSLIYLIIGICCNFIMNLLKITSYIGAASDDLTSYFSIAESTLIVEALRGDPSRSASASDYVCENCGIQMAPKSSKNSHSSRSKTAVDLEQADQTDIPEFGASSVNALVQTSLKKGDSEIA